VWKPVDETIWICELMEKYWQKFSYWESEIPVEQFDLLKWKMINDRNKK